MYAIRSYYDLTVTGATNSRLTVNGTKEALTADLTTDLSGVAIRYQDAEIKKPDSPGTLVLSAELTPEKVLLQQGELQLTPISVKAEGSTSPQRPIPVTPSGEPRATARRCASA